MKAYYYLLFRIYRFYTDKMKEKDSPLSYTSAISTVLIYVNLFTIYGLLNYFQVIPMIYNKYYILGLIGLIWFLNHLFIVKRKKFLECNFTKDVKGGVLVILYIVATAALFIIVANYNREKIFADKVRQEQMETERNVH